MSEEPYVGPRPFARRDRDVFFARDREANELLSLITAHPAVLLYSRSGAGKSSLLNAKLIPLLEEDGFEVLPTVRVRLSVPSGIDPQAVSNLFVFNTLLCLAAGRVPAETLRGISIAELLNRSSGPGELERAPRVMIIDQLEELFTAFPERWSERRGFFEQLGDALEQDRLLRLVLAIREDYIAELDPYATLLPERLQSRFRLEPLREEAALEAVTKPLEDREKKFDSGVAEELVANLLAVRAAWGGASVKGEFVEPVQLQVVCLNLWQSLQATDSATITSKHLEEFGDVDRALSELYERAILGAAESHKIKEGVLRRWFETRVITPARTRGAVFQGLDETGGLPNRVVADLEGEHLVAGQLRGGARWYELAHDRLIEPVLESNRRWLLARSGAEHTRLHLETRAAHWVDTGRGGGELLDEGELAEAERWLASPDADELGFTEQLRSYVQASRSAVDETLHRKEMERIEALAEEQRRRGRILKTAVAIVSVLLVVLVGLSLFSLAQRNKAEVARQREEAARRGEQRQRKIAEDALVAVRAAKAKVDAQSEQLEDALEAAIVAQLREAEQRKRAELASLRAQQDKAVAERERRVAQAALAERDAAESADALQREASALYEKGDLPLALSKYEESLAFYRQARNATGVADVRNKIGEIKADEGDFHQALHSFQEALAIYRSVSDPVRVGAVLLDIGRAREALGDSPEALAVYGEALEVFRSQGARELEAVTLATIAMTRQEMGDRTGATAAAEDSLRLARQIGDRSVEISALSTLGMIHREAGDFQRSLAMLQEALQISETESQRANALLNLGATYNDLGNQRQALERLTAALPLLRASGDRYGELAALDAIGRVYSDLGEKEKALESFEQALNLQRMLGDPREEADILNNLGQLYSSIGQNDRAASLLRRALSVYEMIADSQGEASTLVNVGEVARSGNRLEEAAEAFSRAAALAKESSDRRTESAALYGLARTRRDQGRLQEASRLMQGSVEILESLRANVTRSDLRASFSSSIQNHYEDLIDILMRLHASDPAGGHAGTALEVSERYRARSLLESLTEIGTDLRRGGDPALLERERRLSDQLNEKTALRQQLRSTPEGEARLPVVDRDIESLTAEYEEVQALLREQRSRSAHLVEPSPLSVAEIQGLLDSETALLEFALGEEKSFLWVVRRDSVSSFELPPRRSIEEGLGLLRARPATRPSEEVDFWSQMFRLSDVLLGPARELLTLPRLAIVADGALAHLPFAALPDPTRTGDDLESRPPLLFQREIVLLPSASTLALLRRLGPRRHPGRTIAVIANPTLSTSNLSPLPGTALEAERILSLVPRDQSLRAEGIDAQRSLVIGGGLKDFRILHFATHTIFDRERPELSSIVLSTVDRQGRPQDGFVRAYEISRLDLSAELVVLSGSETALGQENRSEGPIGLSRSFMDAGVPRIVASLWPVDDRSTAELMGSFYRHLLVEGMTASQALRAAQIEMAKSEKRSSPYHWASFTLLGDWR